MWLLWIRCMRTYPCQTHLPRVDILYTFHSQARTPAPMGTASSMFGTATVVEAKTEGSSEGVPNPAEQNATSDATATPTPTSTSTPAAVDGAGAPKEEAVTTMSVTNAGAVTAAKCLEKTWGRMGSCLETRGMDWVRHVLPPWPGSTHTSVAGRFGNRVFCGSLDGMTAHAFHKLCDNKGLLLITVAAKGAAGEIYVFGGFLDTSATSSDGIELWSISVFNRRKGEIGSTILPLWGPQRTDKFGTARLVVDGAGPIVGQGCVWTGGVRAYDPLGNCPDGPGIFVPEEVEAYTLE